MCRRAIERDRADRSGAVKKDLLVLGHDVLLLVVSCVALLMIHEYSSE
jgi:hypothetical protein